MAINERDQMLDKLVEQLRSQNMEWPTIHQVLSGNAPKLPAHWHWRTMCNVRFPYAYREKSDIILVPSRYQFNRGR